MTKTRWLTADEERAWRAINRLLVALPARLGRDLAAQGLSTPDYEVLSTLSEKADGRWPLKEMAAKMEWSRSRLSRHVSRMADRGLVEKQADASDARGCLLRLSESGRSALSRVAPHHLHSVRARLIDHLTPAELASLERISNRIADLPAGLE
ncbi:MarR family transcriptional regulator [Parafrigoribacterium mesophilum]|uniref:MarR family winged helix-turn-helix transcriptional regulator n=1 Tax=Parafrigoribacterium mesophilum TaxID=433646 RepID=UPI0031FC6B4A